MSLTDPRAALAEQSSFVGYLLGVAAAAASVRALATDAVRVAPAPDADDFVHVLLGLVCLGAAIEDLVEPATHQSNPRPVAPAPTRWLR